VLEPPAEVVASSDAAQVAVDTAMAQLGDPYVWAASGPDAFDCSGLTQYAYARAGVAIPRNSRAQFASLPRVPVADLQPGDLVFWAQDPTNPDTIHHVAIYLGHGQVLQSPESGEVVTVSAIWWDGYAGAVRPSS
jgi:peptidoglycan DL-endopeptidase RipA